MTNKVRLMSLKWRRVCIMLASGSLLAACGEKSHSTMPEVYQPATAAASQQSLCPPLDNYVSEEKRTTVAQWNADLIECSYGPEASDVLSTTVYTVKAGGSVHRIASGISGTVLVLPKSEAIFSCDDNSGALSGAPKVVRLNGSSVLLPEHAGRIDVCERVGDGEQVLIQYAEDEDSQTFAIVRIFNGDGTLLVDKRFDDAGEVEFFVNGAAYSAAVLKPQ